MTEKGESMQHAATQFEHTLPTAPFMKLLVLLALMLIAPFLLFLTLGVASIEIPKEGASTNTVVLLLVGLVLVWGFRGNTNLARNKITAENMYTLVRLVTIASLVIVTCNVAAWSLLWIFGILAEPTPAPFTVVRTAPVSAILEGTLAGLVLFAAAYRSLRTKCTPVSSLIIVYIISIVFFVRFHPIPLLNELLICSLCAWILERKAALVPIVVLYSLNSLMLAPLAYSVALMLNS